MKKSIKKIVSLGLAVTMTVGLAACSSSETADTKEPAETKEATGTTEPEVAKADEPVTLSITWWGGQGRHEYTQELLDLYTELNPHVTFQASPSGWDGYFDKLSTQAASGAMPDIMQMDYLYISTYASNNSIADLKPYMDSGIIDVSNIPATTLNTGLIGDEMAGLVLSSTAIGVVYNPDVLAAAGVATPETNWTWKDFIATNQAVSEKNGSPSATMGPVDDTNMLNYWVRQHGESLFSDDNLTLGYSDDQIVADYIQMWADLMEEGVVSNPDEYEAIKALGDEANPVITGDAGMMFGWGNSAAKVEHINPNVKITTPPLLGSGEDKGLWAKPGQFFCVAETSPNKEEAAKFINWFVNSKEANDIIMAERGIPVSSEIKDYLINSGNLTEQQIASFEFMDTVATMAGDAPNPDPAGISEINQVFKDTAYKVFYGQSTSIDAAKSFRTEAENILARNN